MKILIIKTEYHFSTYSGAQAVLYQVEIVDISYISLFLRAVQNLSECGD